MTQPLGVMIEHMGWWTIIPIGGTLIILFFIAYKVIQAEQKNDKRKDNILH